MFDENQDSPAADQPQVDQVPAQESAPEAESVA